MDTSMLDFAAQTPERIHLVRYEDLVEDKEAVLSSIWEFLGVPKVPVASEYAPNSSFQTLTQDRTKRTLPQHTYEIEVIRWFYHQGLPALPKTALYRFKKVWHGTTRAALPPWFFKLIDVPHLSMSRNGAVGARTEPSGDYPTC